MQSQEIIQKFRDAKFGLFLHWGVYSVRSRGEWAIFRDEVPREEYARYKAMFNPVRFDADQWVGMAKKAGMKYICINSKHHDGFCLFDSAYTDWKITEGPFKRDIIAEVGDACRRAGMLFGIYYSIWDLWHPGLNNGYASMDPEGKVRGEEKAVPWKPGEEGITYMHNQVEELCTKYGKVDYFFFDVRKAPGEAYRGTGLIEKMRQWQPEMIINDRLGVPADCASPENVIPDEPILDDKGNLLLWESNMCSNKNWAYVHDDKSFKDSDEIIGELVNTVSKGGNYLINVGPTALGEFPRENVRMLEEVGQWMEYHKEAIYGCELYALGGGASHFRWRGLCATRNKEGNRIYVHIPNYPSGAACDSKVEFALPEREVDFITLMEDGTEVPFRTTGYYGKGPGTLSLLLPREPGHRAVTTAVINLK